MCALVTGVQTCARPIGTRGDLRALAGGEEGREALCGEARVFLGSQARIDSRRKERPQCPVKPTSTAATFRTARPPCTSRTAATSSPTADRKRVVEGSRGSARVDLGGHALDQPNN